MKLVSIPEERFLELIDAERSAESCKSCGPLAQRDRLIDAKDAEIVRLKELVKKHEAAVACIGSMEGILRSGASDAKEGALTRIRQYHEDLDRIEKGVVS